MRSICAALLAAVALAACGSDGQPAKATARGDEGAIRVTMEHYAAAIRAGDARRICRELMSREVLDRIERLGGDCARDFIAGRVKEGGPKFTLTVRSVKVTGDRAMTTGDAVESDGPRRADQPLVREAGGWKLALEAP
jgi:ketosteroid isomerase-like protein